MWGDLRGCGLRRAGGGEPARGDVLRGAFEGLQVRRRGALGTAQHEGGAGLADNRDGHHGVADPARGALTDDHHERAERDAVDDLVERHRRARRAVGVDPAQLLQRDGRARRKRVRDGQESDRRFDSELRGRESGGVGGRAEEGDVGGTFAQRPGLVGGEQQLDRRGGGAACVGLEQVGQQARTGAGPGLATRVRALVPSGVDAVLDTVGRGALSSTSDLTSAEVRVASIAEFPFPGTVPVFARLDQRDLLTLVELAEAGTLSVRVARTFPLAQAADAQRLLAEGHAPGKVVLVP